MNWNAKKVLVTGAEGFIGSHLTERLVELGADVTALVQYNSFNNWGWIDAFDNNVKNSINVITGDIREYDNVKRMVKGQEVIMHLAALIAIPYSYLSPMAYVRTNVEGTTNVLEACRDEENIEKIVKSLNLKRELSIEKSIELCKILTTYEVMFKSTEDIFDEFVDVLNITEDEILATIKKILINPSIQVLSSE